MSTALSLAPRLQLNVSYDANITALSDEQIALHPTSQINGLALVIQPSLKLIYDRKRIDVSLYHEQFVRLYMNALASELSSLDDMDNKAELIAFPEALFGFAARNVFTVRRYHNGQEVDADGTGSDGARRIFNDLTFSGQYRPGPALEFSTGIRWGHDVQDFLNLESIDVPVKNDLGLNFRGNWKFFPKTSLVLDAGWSRGIWSNLPECVSVATGCETYNLSAKSDLVTMWNLMSGIAGQVTHTIQANVFLGYGNLYNRHSEEAENVRGWNGFTPQLQIAFSPLALKSQTVSLAFSRRFVDSSLFDYAIYNSIAFAYRGQFFVDRLTSSLTLALDYRNINSAEVGELPTRTDRVVTANLGSEYRLTKWLSAQLLIKPSSVVPSANGSSLNLDEDLSWSEICSTCSSYEDYLDYTFQHQTLQVTLGVRGIY